MPLSEVEYLRHILLETAYVIFESQNLTEEAFLQDETLKRAFVRSIEVIGEAVKQVPDSVRLKYSDIQWRLIGRMRD